MKPRLLNPVILLSAIAAMTACATMRAQVAPAAFAANSKLTYDLLYSQTASFAKSFGGTQQRGVASGELDYSNGKLHSPLQATYSGGYIFGIGNTDSETGVFQHLRVSQGYFEEKWGVDVRDDVSYSPQTPTRGFSGIPGVGTLPALPDIPAGTILNSRTFYNVVGGEFTRSVTHSTTVKIDSNYSILRYPNGASLETNAVGFGPQFTWRLDSLNTVTIQYNFSRFAYVGSPLALQTQSIQPGYIRTWSRRLTTGVTAGPEWTGSNESHLIPSSTGIAANGWASYESRFISAKVRYYRAVSTGVGYGSQIAIRNNDTSADISHTFGRNLSVVASGSYLQTQGLLQVGATHEEFGGVNLTRQLSPGISVSAGYTALHQTSTLALPSSALAGLDQVIGFNLSFHPHEGRIIGK